MKPTGNRKLRSETAQASGPSMHDLEHDFSANFEIVLADTDELIREVYALRYQVYCVENAYEDPAMNPGGLETDEFDERSVHALLRHKPTGMCAGAVRLVTVDSEHPDQEFPIEVFCQAAFDAADQARMAAMPRTRTGEISRFAVSKAFRRRFAEHLSTTGITEENLLGDGRDAHLRLVRRTTSQITVGLFCGLFRLSVAHGITHWYAVMEPSLLRLLERFGIHFEKLGHPIMYHGRRQPALADVAQVTEGVRRYRPDIWALATDDGAIGVDGAER